MVGLNYRYLLSAGTYNKLITEVQTIIPAFMAWCIDCSLITNLFYHTGVIIGYAVKSKNLSIFNEDFFVRNSVD